MAAKQRKPFGGVMIRCQGGPLDGGMFTYRSEERIVVPSGMKNQIGKTICHAYVLTWVGERWIWKHDGVED